MKKLQNNTTQEQHDIIGEITFMVGEEGEQVEQTNYTIVIDDVTTTIESTDEDWQVIDAPEPETVPDPEPVPEPEPEPTPEPETPAQPAQPSAEDIADEAARHAEEVSRQTFVTAVNRLIVAIAAKNIALNQGKQPNELNNAFISGSLDYIQDTMTSRPEYLDLIDKDTLLSLMALLK